MYALGLTQPGKPLSVLCLGAHADDIEIGAGGTILTLLESGATLDVHWCIASANGGREAEARNSAAAFLTGAAKATIEIGAFRDSYLPSDTGSVKEWLETQKPRMKPDVVLTHRRDDAHQDHRLISELTSCVFRDSLILEYEIPKWDGDFGRPNLYIGLSEEVLARKIALLNEHFVSQRSKHWFSGETFRSLACLRGIECRKRYAEGFTSNKILIG
jgi:LmbE family N-acetylglucosaminyl deacetylase